MTNPADTHDETAIQARLVGTLAHWSLVDGRLWRQYTTGSWRVTLMIVNAIGHLAEAAWHHPELEVSYGSVIVRLHTHDAGGITDKDFELARELEHTILWRPAAGAALTGLPANQPHLRYVDPDT
ncbi:MAG: 4a-hydroxytetrahydrobiopterin dehydratase [Burkholderiaceae bacterium]